MHFICHLFQINYNQLKYNKNKFYKALKWFLIKFNALILVKMSPISDISSSKLDTNKNHIIKCLHLETIYFTYFAN